MVQAAKNATTVKITPRVTRLKRASFALLSRTKYPNPKAQTVMTKYCRNTCIQGLWAIFPLKSTSVSGLFNVSGFSADESVD
jgi:hypothetical protein